MCFTSQEPQKLIGPEWATISTKATASKLTEAQMTAVNVWYILKTILQFKNTKMYSQASSAKVAFPHMHIWTHLYRETHTHSTMAPRGKFCGPLWLCECVVSALQNFALEAPPIKSVLIPEKIKACFYKFHEVYTVKWNYMFFC